MVEFLGNNEFVKVHSDTAMFYHYSQVSQFLAHLRN